MNTPLRTIAIAIASIAAIALAACTSDDLDESDLEHRDPDEVEAADGSEAEAEVDVEAAGEDEAEVASVDAASFEPESDEAFEHVLEVHRQFIAASDLFLREGEDALEELAAVASDWAISDVIELHLDMVANGYDVAGFRTPDPYYVEFRQDQPEFDEVYIVRDCVVDQRRIFDPEISEGIADEDITKEWLAVMSYVTQSEDGEFRVAHFVDDWSEYDRDNGCIHPQQVQRIEAAVAELAVRTQEGLATNDPADYDGVFEPQYIERYFSRIDDLDVLLELDIETGVRLIGADPYLASLVVCGYGFAREVHAETGEVLRSDDTWGDSRTGFEFLVSGVDTGEFLVREVVQGSSSDYSGWCIGEVEFTQNVNTISDPSAVPTGERDNRWARGERVGSND